MAHKLHAYYTAQYLYFVMYKTDMENEKNYVTSRYAETYTTHCTASQRHSNKFRAGLALIPLSTDPDGVRTAPGGIRTVSVRLRMAFSRTRSQ